MANSAKNFKAIKDSAVKTGNSFEKVESPYELEAPVADWTGAKYTEVGMNGNPIGGRMILIIHEGEELRLPMHKSTTFQKHWKEGTKVSVGRFAAPKDWEATIDGRTVVVKKGTTKTKAYIDACLA